MTAKPDYFKPWREMWTMIRLDVADQLFYLALKITPEEFRVPIGRALLRYWQNRPPWAGLEDEPK